MLSLSLTLFGCGRLLGRSYFALAKKAAVAKLPEDVEEENSGDAQHDQAFKEAVHGGDGAADDDTADPGERDYAEQNGNQEHHGKQETSSENSCQWSVLSS